MIDSRSSDDVLKDYTMTLQKNTIIYSK